MAELKLFIRGTLDMGMHPYFYRSEFDLWGMACLFQGVNMYDENMSLCNRLTDNVILTDKYMDIQLKDVCWHDNSPITSNDLVYSLEVINSQKSYLSNRLVSRSVVGIEDYFEGNSEHVSGFEIIDNKKIRIHTKGFDENLRTMLVVPIIPQKYNSSIPIADFFNREHKEYSRVGCGSYIIEEEKSDLLRFTRNNNFTLGKPNIEKLTMYGGSIEKQKNCIVEKSVDFSVINSDMLEYVDKDFYDIYSLPQLGSTILSINYKKESNKKLSFRQYINSSINKEKIVKELFDGHAFIMNQFYPYVHVCKYNINNSPLNIDEKIIHTKEQLTIGYNPNNSEHKHLAQCLYTQLEKNFIVDIKPFKNVLDAFDNGADLFINELYHQILPYSTRYFSILHNNFELIGDSFQELFNEIDKLQGYVHDKDNVIKFAELTRTLLPCIFLYNKSEIQIVTKKLHGIKADSRGVLWNIHELTLN